MTTSEFDWKDVDPLIEGALKEDLGETGDITTESTISSDLQGRGEITAQEDGIAAGLPVAQRVFQRIDQGLVFSDWMEDGTTVRPGMVLGVVQGSVASILKAERTALNFLQRLSGIATQTSLFVQAIQGTKARLLDTRKTTPQLRLLEKYAVRQGGGMNHRFGLYDMVLIKDNHIAASGGLKQAIERCLSYLRKIDNNIKIEIEVRTLDGVKEALRYPIHRIMLDNMDLETMRQAVREVGGRVEVEASGRVTLESIRAVAETGVDFISSGALTHSVKALDISLKLVVE